MKKEKPPVPLWMEDDDEEDSSKMAPRSEGNDIQAKWNEDQT